MAKKSKAASKIIRNEAQSQLLRVEIASLMLDANNARTHSPRNIEAIKASLSRFGQQKPIVINEQGVVIAGNGTLLAAKALGWEHLNATRSSLNSVEAIAYAIADNRTAELAEWDMQALVATLDALRADGEGLDLAAGFDAEEIAKMLNPLGNKELAIFPKVDETIHTESQCPKCGYRWSGGKMVEKQEEASDS